MKTVLVGIFTLMLLGCSVLAVPHWDSTEYSVLTKLSTMSTRGTCEPAQTEKLSWLSAYLANYSEFLPNNSLVHAGVIEMDKTIQDLDEEAHKAPVSKVYCSLRLRVIHAMAAKLAETVGEMPR